MRLIDFLILLLEAQAETLKRLAAFFGEDRLLEMLELEGGPPVPELNFEQVPFASIGTRLPAGGRSPYVELEGSVREFSLPAMLEFHLWAYPYYRAFIESDLDLGSLLSEGGKDSAVKLGDEAIFHAKEWIRHLHIPPAVSAEAEAAALQPWIRFRSSVMRKIGLRPMGPVL